MSASRVPCLLPTGLGDVNWVTKQAAASARPGMLHGQVLLHDMFGMEPHVACGHFLRVYHRPARCSGPGGGQTASFWAPRRTCPCTYVPLQPPLSRNLGPWRGDSCE